jgi:translation initiation factor IF-1
MAKEEAIKMEGTVIEVLPGSMYRVDVSGHLITAYLGGKMKQNKIKVVEGDRVEVEMTPYDLTKGRITFRFK